MPADGAWPGGRARDACVRRTVETDADCRTGFGAERDQVTSSRSGLSTRDIRRFMLATRRVAIRSFFILLSPIQILPDHRHANVDPVRSTCTPAAPGYMQGAHHLAQRHAWRGSAIGRRETRAPGRGECFRVETQWRGNRFGSGRQRAKPSADAGRPTKKYPGSGIEPGCNPPTFGVVRPEREEEPRPRGGQFAAILCRQVLARNGRIRQIAVRIGHRHHTARARAARTPSAQNR